MHDIRPFLPELFGEPGTLLYIGARSDAHSWLIELYESGNKIIILEVWENNINELREFIRDFDEIWITQGDVRSIGMPAGLERFDYIFWWHGPEHLSQDEILTTLTNLESKANKMIALACPYGWYPQGAHDGNPYERHQSTLYPQFFEMLGYQTKTDGEKDQAESEIVAWKKISGNIEK